MSNKQDDPGMRERFIEAQLKEFEKEKAKVKAHLEKMEHTHGHLLHLAAIARREDKRRQT